MKLPEQIPRELVGLLVDKMFDGACEDISPLVEIYDVIVDYFNYQPTEWHPVSEKPEHECAVWLFDGDIVTFGIFVADVFAPIGDGIREYRHTHWTYANVPQPPKE